MKRKIKKIISKGLGVGNKMHQSIRMKFAKINEKPVFIVGNQKTGSTAIACLLAKATDSSLSQDFLFSLDPPGQEILYKKGVPLEKVVEEQKYFFSKDIIKELDLIFCLDQVISCFPEGKFVFIIRDPRDNIRSILNRLKLPGNLDKLSEEHWATLPNSVWRDMLQGGIYGIEAKCYIEMLAKRWCHIIEQYEAYNSDIHLLRYEDFVQDKVLSIHQLARQLGLEALNDIHDSVDIQYQPKGDHEISWMDFFGEFNLVKIETICSSKMRSYGYEPLLYTEE